LSRRRRHTRFSRDWSSDVCSSDLKKARKEAEQQIIEIQTNAELIKIEMKSAEKNLDAVRARIEAAKRQGDRELLIELLMHEEEISEESRVGKGRRTRV